MRRAPLVSPPILALALLLAACATPQQHPRNTYGEPQVIPAQAVLAVSFRPGQAALHAAERTRIGTFLADNGVVRGDRVGVAGEDGGGLAEQRAAALRADLHARGLRPDIASVAEPLPGAVALVIDRSWAMVPGCPDWTDDWRVKLGNPPSANFGCATAMNMAAGVARPRDLLSGEVPDAARAPATNAAKTQGGPSITISAPGAGARGGS